MSLDDLKNIYIDQIVVQATAGSRIPDSIQQVTDFMLSKRPKYDVVIKDCNGFSVTFKPNKKW
jgi:hypothetical protein